MACPCPRLTQGTLLDEAVPPRVCGAWIGFRDPASKPGAGSQHHNRGRGTLLPSPKPAPATFPTWPASGFVPASKGERFPQTLPAMFFSNFQCLPLPVTWAAKCILIKYPLDPTSNTLIP